MDVTVRKFYSFQEIHDRIKPVDVAKKFTKVEDGRCAALWRGGDNLSSVSMNEKGWHDFGTGESGDAIELYAKFANVSRQKAQEVLGDELGLVPKRKVQKGHTFSGRVEKLKEAGYTLSKRYNYTDETGKLVHCVERWEHPTKKKEFVQTDADGRYSVKHVKTVLYRLKDWHDKPYVAIVEGEKDANTLNDKRHLFATTNASGASNWQDHYNDYLKGKDIIIIADNDDPGMLRANQLLWDLKDVVKDMKLVTFKDEAQGFDITDFYEKYGHEAAMKKISDTPVIDKTCVRRPHEDYNAIQIAKERNKLDFQNFFAFKAADENGKPKTQFLPRQINDMIKECHERFLSFPRRIGDRIFDHDRESGRIEFLHNVHDLFAWIARKSKHHINWKTGENFVCKNEFFAGLFGSAKQYESIAFSPSFPLRTDTYYAHPALPAAGSERSYLDGFISNFNPASEQDRVLIKAMTISPLYYRAGIPKPAWIIDSEDGAGTGKTTLAEMIAFLYNTDPIRTTPSEMTSKFSDITKRIVSSSGRMCKVFLLDNVTGDFRCPTLADMITARSISGKAPYGRGEESRPNDLTYIITANSAMVDNDLAQRSWTIHVKRSEFSPLWRGELIKYISDHRYNIIAEIVDMIEKNADPLSHNPVTRFPEFETEILQACCGDMDAYSEVIKRIHDAKAAANVEEDEAQNIAEVLRQGMLNIPDIYPDIDNVLIRSAVVEKWFKEAGMKVQGYAVQHVRNLAKNGLLKNVNPRVVRWPHGNGRRGIFWENKVGTDSKAGVKIVGVCNGNASQVFQ